MNLLLKNCSIVAFLIIFLSLSTAAVSAIEENFMYSIISDDSRYALKSTENNTVYFFDTEKNATSWSYNIGRYIGSVAISPDSKYVAVGSEGGLIWLFDQKGDVVWNKTFGNAGIKSIEFSKDSQYLDASNFINQAFYISLEGSPATRPTSSGISDVPSIIPTVTPAQIPINLDLSSIESIFRNNLNLLLGIVIGLSLAGIAWYVISRRGFRQRGIIAPGINNINLSNFTIFSILLVLAGFLPNFFPLSNYTGLFQTAFVTGVICFLLAYFLYALKCWGSDNQIRAIFMVSIPLLAYFLATSKIPDSTTNILFYLVIQFCFYAIISAILLYICDKVKKGIEGVMSKRSRRSYGYFTPELSYSVIGVFIVSFILVNYGGLAIFTDNTHTVTQSLQKTISPVYSTSDTGPSPTSANSQNLPIPTLQPDIVKSIESTVGNAPPAIDIRALEMEIHTGINQQRRSNGLSPLSYDSSLASIARKHSADMAQNSFFSHYNLQGLDPTGRGNREGYSCYKDFGSYYMTGIAENIMQNNLYDSITYYNGIPRYSWNTQEEIAQSTVNGWMTSPGHRQNILTSTYNREGIGVAIAADDKVYITEDFC